MSDYVLKDLSFSYPPKKKGETPTKVFENLSLTFDQGEFIFLEGSSGSGKTTLLRLLAGLLDPDHGTFMNKGENLFEFKTQSRDLGYCFQEAFLYPFATVYGNIYMALNGFGLSRLEKDKLIKGIIKDTDLLPLLNYKPKQLSVGQTKTVALCRALIRKPSLLLADEPFAGTDERLKDRLRQKMFRICKDNHTSVIYVSHDIKESLGFDSRYRLEDGNIIKII